MKTTVKQNATKNSQTARQMSELKAITVYDAYWKANSVGDGTGIFVYLKSEADKVIADLEESHKKEVEQLLMEIVELKHSLELATDECCSISQRAVKNARHHKYKRCLWTAMWCKSKSEIYNEFAADASEYMPSYESRFRSKAVLYQKWAMRWLELAEKFKEAK